MYNSVLVDAGQPHMSGPTGVYRDFFEIIEKNGSIDNLDKG
jgi:hypothetical protein